MGGLTVLMALQAQCPLESTIYLGDLAHLPYGPRPQEEVRGFALEIGDYLAAQDIKLLLVACNTATAAAFGALRERYPFPVVGVIEPGAQEAVRVSDSGHIGVIATDGTVASGAYRDAILLRAPDAVVVQRSASWLVPIIEQGAPARGEVARRLLPTLTEMRREGIDTLILGCTHFPLVGDIFDNEVGPGIRVVDSAATSARAVADLLAGTSASSTGTMPPVRRILITGEAGAFARRAETMFHASPHIESIDLSFDVVR